MSSDNKTPARGKRSIGRILAALAALALLGVLTWVIWEKLRDNVWAYYTDDEGTRVEVEEEKARPVLWEDPRQNNFTEKRDPEAPAVADPVNQPGGRLEAAFSPNGTMIILVRWEKIPEDEAEERSDMYLSHWNGRVWTRPEAVLNLNSPSNDRGPAFSHDGNLLYFTSDREGGSGGYDLYVARWDGSEWGAVEALGDPVNSPSDELGPAPSADGSRLYFSSGREGQREDIFVARALPPEVSVEPETPVDPEVLVEPKAPETPTLPPLPKFAAPEPAGHLNSEADDVQAALTNRGDHVFLASDRDRNEKAGFGVYLSRVVGGEPQPPEKVDLYIDEGDATDPAVRMEGFDLLFSRDVPAATEPAESVPGGYVLFRSTTREVFGFTDLTRWSQFKELMKNIGWWIVLAIAALIALIYLLERWRDITSLFHKCLAGSAAVHLIILFLMMIWLITKEFDSGGEPQAPEIAISIDALAQEQLALESTPEEAKMAETPVALVTDKLVSDFKIPRFEPQPETKTAPIVSSTAKTSLVTDIRPSKANTAAADQPVPKPTKNIPLLTALPDTFLPEPENPLLEERAPSEITQKAPEPANPEADLFRPTDSIPQVITKKSEEEKTPTNVAVKDTPTTKEIDPGGEAAETKDTGGDVIVAHRGLEAVGQPQAYDGTGTAAAMSLNLPGLDSESDPLLPGELETPKHDLDPNALTKLIRKQRGKPSQETIEELGGSDATERAIGAALEWLSKHQEPDGHWDTRKYKGNGDYDTGSTGLALLCYYGWGVSHTKGGKYQKNVRKAIDWLVAQQKENGDLRGGGRMYCHGIATMALCEAYGVSEDPKLKEPAEKAIALILAAQCPTKGGWRYDVNPGDSDTSVTGWQYMALHSAQMAGIEVPESAFKLAQKWFDHAGGGRHGGIYGYTGPEANKPAMVATGMFCRQLDLVPPTDPRMPESAEVLKKRKINVSNPDYYYVYYGTLALYQHQGPVWTDWNERLKDTLTLIQVKNGDESGSWNPGSGHSAAGGRIISTTMATLSLEVYYRLLPMYGFRNKDAEPPAKRKGNEN